MANTIKPKRTTTSGNNPTTSNLAEGEIAINLADKKLYVRDTGNNILTLADGALADKTTDNLTEGSSNLYYTDAKVDAYIDPGIDLSGSSRIRNDLRVDGDLSLSNIAILAGDGTLLGLTHTANTPNPSTQNTRMAITQIADHTDQTTYIGDFGWQHRANGKDRFEIRQIPDTGGQPNTMLRMAYNDVILLGRTNATSSPDFQITGGGAQLNVSTTIDDTLTVNDVTNLGKMVLSTEAADTNSILDTTSMPNTDTLHNHFKASLDYGGSTVPDGAKSSITFSALSDTQSDFIVARFGSSYDTGNNNALEFEVSDNGGNFVKTVFNNEMIDTGTPVKLKNLSSDPSNPSNGWVYYNDSTHKMRLYANGAWVDLN